MEMINGVQHSKITHQRSVLEQIIKEWNTFCAQHDWNSTSQYPTIQGFKNYLESVIEVEAEENADLT